MSIEKSAGSAGPTQASSHLEVKELDVKQQHEHSLDFDAPLRHVEELQHYRHVQLSWRSWVAVFTACCASFSQLYAVISSGFLVTFVIQDLGSPNIAGWIVQGPLLMQCVLGPILGRLSDVLSRKYLAAFPPLVALAGAIVSAKASSMTTLIGGGILIGTTLSTIAIIQAIPSEILPLKFRPLANGLMFLSGSIGGTTALLVPGAFASASPSGWRNSFWLQAGLHGATCLGLLIGYNPIRGSDYGKTTWKQTLWLCDPVGSFLFITGSTLTLMALNWSGTTYAWSNPRVAALLAIGLSLLLGFCLYEWKGRSDGLVAHVLFKGSPNFVLALLAFTLEGWVFYSAINSVLPAVFINLGFEKSAWGVAVRQMASSLPTLFYAAVVIWYSTTYKDLRSPLIVCYIVFLATIIAYCFISPGWGRAQFGLAAVQAAGTAGPFTLLTAVIQFSAPHSHLSTATGLAFSARAMGGAFGSAILNTIIGNKLKTYPSKIGAAAVQAGLPASSVPALLQAFATKAGFSEVNGLTPDILSKVMNTSQWTYTHVYRLAWCSVIPLAAVALIAVCFLRDVGQLMTERIEAPVERVIVESFDGREAQSVPIQ